MAFAYALDPVTPAGGEAASLGDDRIREFKNAMIERVNSRFVDVNADPWIIKTPLSGGNTQSLTPTADNTYVLGTAALRFSDLRAVIATISSGLTVVAGGVTVSAGGITVTGASTITGTLGGITTLTATTLAGTLSTAAQPNITSVGTLTSLTVSGAFSVGTLTTTGGAGAASITMPATGRFYVDGGGDSYFYEASANIISFVVGAAARFQVASDVAVLAGDFRVDATKRIYLDGGGDTYLVEFGANDIRVVAGGSTQLELSTTQFIISQETIIPATKKLYLDGGGDTYLYEAIANQINIIAGTALSAAFNATQVVLGSPIDLLLQATKRFYVDGGGNTYISEQSADAVEVVAGGTRAIRITSSYLEIGPASSAVDLLIGPTHKAYLDGGGDTYIYESTANIIDIVNGTGGGVRFPNIGTSGSAANAFLDGAASNGMYRSTSSVKYKDNVQELALQDAAALIFGSRPITYTSLCERDNPATQFIGLIAEEVYDIDRRLVFLHDGVPDGVMYDRFVPPIILVLQDINQRLISVERTVNGA